MQARHRRRRCRPTVESMPRAIARRDGRRRARPRRSPARPASPPTSPARSPASTACCSSSRSPPSSSSSSSSTARRCCRCSCSSPASPRSARRSSSSSRSRRADVLLLNGQTQGILFILVIGAATDYSLLYIARYREALAHARAQVGRHLGGAPRLVRADPRLGRHGHRRPALLLFSDLNSNKIARPGGRDRHRLRAARRRSPSCRRSCSGPGGSRSGRVAAEARRARRTDDAGRRRPDGPLAAARPAHRAPAASDLDRLDAAARRHGARA